MALPAARAAELETVTIRLKWLHQFQFAGYYAAVEQGYYRDVGLAVEILEGQPGAPVVDSVVSGRAQYGVQTSSLLVERAKGAPVVVLAALFQRSPVALLSLESSGIHRPRDVVGRRVMMDQGGMLESEILAMLRHDGVELGDFEAVGHSWDIEDLVDGRVDAMTAYVTADPLLLQRRGIPYSLMIPLEHDVDFYGDCLFTSEQELGSHPERVAAFREASLRGWVYAMSHTEEIIDLLQTRYASRLTRDQLVYEAEAMKTLRLPRLVETGHMNLERWHRIRDTFADLGMIPADQSLDGFLYEPAASDDFRWALWVAGGAGLALIIIGALLVFNQRLTLAVSTRTAELTRLNADLQKEIEERSRAEAQFLQSQKLEAVGTLAGGIAHDFNNLLTGILDGLELALLELGPNNSRARDRLRQSQEAGRRAAELTENLLALSRRSTPDLEVLDANAVILRTARLLQRSLPETIEIGMTLDPRVPPTRGHEGQVGQALLNLGINARDAMPDGGQLHLESALETLDPAAPPGREGPFIRVTVRDDGAGISPEDRDRVFEPFFTTKGQGKGTGLGLSMVYTCMQAHEGWVSVESESGEGSRFHLYFPAVEVEVQEAEEPRLEEPPSGTETVLLVDDTDAVLFLGRGMLERCGYRVLVAWDGEEALARVDECAGAVDLVITDLVMPRLSGRDLLLGLRERGCDAPVVLTTGYGMTSRAQALDEGFAELIPKPFDMLTLARAARAAIDGARSHSARGSSHA